MFWAIPKGEEHQYEITLHNQRVREQLKENQEDKQFDERWADDHRFTVCATTEKAALDMISRVFRHDDGFVIDGIQDLS